MLKRLHIVLLMLLVFYTRIESFLHKGGSVSFEPLYFSTSKKIDMAKEFTNPVFELLGQLPHGECEALITRMTTAYLASDNFQELTERTRSDLMNITHFNRLVGRLLSEIEADMDSFELEEDENENE